MANLPDGEEAPVSGELPNPDVSKGFSAYVHVPFCAVRCGYCDFNTYSNLDFGPGASVADYHESVEREIKLSAQVLGPDAGALQTVFFGGGTPTMLPSAALVHTLDSLRNTFGIEDGAEITTEVNPESVTFDDLKLLRDGGFTRMSFGMQSAVPHVLATLDRQHTPGQVDNVVGWARELGLTFSLDLIYGAPGESMADWEESLEKAIELNPPHISAYGLTIEAGTKMGTQLRRGEIEAPDPDELAEKYIAADEAFSTAGYAWYEVSNWAKPGHESQHNTAYWENANWWGYGPGAHSHINGTRFWNVKHPLAYAGRVAKYESPAAAREVLTDAEQREEQIMLGVRMRYGIATPEHADPAVIAGLIADGLIHPPAAFKGRIQLTRKGRLLADTVIRALW